MMRLKLTLVLALVCSLAENSSWGESNTGNTSEKFIALPLAANAGDTPHLKTIHRDGVPFTKGELKFPKTGSSTIEVGGTIKRIFLLGMTESAKIRGWSEPYDYSVRYFIGDNLGEIRLDYADGTTQVFPLVLGENIWWGPPFNLFPEPLASQARQRQVFAKTIRLYPPAPVKDGNYVAVITPKSVPLQSITIKKSPAKNGTPIINGITLELTGTNEITGAIALTPGIISSAFTEFMEKRSLLQLGQDETETQQQLKDLKLSFYSSDENFKGQAVQQTPEGYAGPDISFKGCLTAEILANAFSYNLQDMLNKVDEDGTYHTSTKSAVWWKDNGMGSTNTGKYYDQCWSRDMGRSLEELSELGYTNKALRCADYGLRMARLWKEDSSLKVGGEFLPPHWGRVINKPNKHIAYENDGHGLMIMFLYRLWERLPNRDEWLRARWPDIKAAGDWILWQFAHPKISGAVNGSLHTTGESANGSGYSVYSDDICMDALRMLAQMADSIGETNSAVQWGKRADAMQAAIGSQYIINAPKYGRAWTLEHAGWPFKSTVLGPLVFLADYEGFAPEDDNAVWHHANEATYQRLVDTYRPFGFYGLTMGYGQGFVTQSALLLDRMHDAAVMLDWLAKEIYDPRFGCFIVSEGVQMDPTRQFWYRFGDLGNGVQEAEIIKTLRLVIGVDDTQPGRLQFYPRMPYGWEEMSVKKYPVLFEQSGKIETARLHYQLKRADKKMNLAIGADHDLGLVRMRLGPFTEHPSAADIRVNGKIPSGITAERSGDSWWIGFIMPVGHTNNAND